jgi:cyclase
MLKKRIIPVLLWKEAGLVKGKIFNSWRKVGSVLPAIKIYNIRDVDELILLNIEATEKKIRPDLQFIKNCLKFCNVPITVGGGIDSLDYARELLKIGADKLSINTASYENLHLIKTLSKEFGKQCIVISIDYKRNSKGILKCYSHNGKVETNFSPIEWAQKVEENGAGEILLTSITNEGMMEGLDTDTAKQIAKKINVPLICSGGAGNGEHIYEIFSKTRASAVGVSSMFQFTDQTPNQIKNFLNFKGIQIRKNVQFK